MFVRKTVPGSITFVLHSDRALKFLLEREIDRAREKES